MNEYTYQEIKISQISSFTKEITIKDMLAFSDITGDKNPLHMDTEYAGSTQFKKPVVFGMLICSLLSTLAGMYLPGKYSLILSVDSNFKKPSFVGDILKITGEVIEKVDSKKIIIIKTVIENQNKKILQTGKMFIQVLK